MQYVQCFVAAVPTANRAAYLAHAERSAALFRELGATRVVEGWGDDLPDGEVTDFRQSVRAEPGETVTLGWHEFDDAATAARAFRQAMSDPRMGELGRTMPFDGRCMIFGGFAGRLDLGSRGEAGYVDGTLVPVPEANQAAYEDLDGRLSAVIMEYGARRISGAWSDDLPAGELTDFRRAVAAEAGEAVAFGWIEWPSRADRDAAWEKVFADARMHADTPPHDNGRRVHGGFQPILDL
ncbi:MAG: DUF1428 family protein [Azospirillaceae bacterium]